MNRFIPAGATDWASIYMPPDRKPILRDGIVWIRLTRGYVAVCSPEDLEKVVQHTWHISIDVCGRVKPYMRVQTGYLGKSLKLHRYLLGIPPQPGMVVDHISADTLDNRRENLRWAYSIDNCRNSPKTLGRACVYKGVTRDRHRYRARIALEGDIIALGCYPSPEDAAYVYNQKALELFGEFARLNVLPSEYTPSSEVLGKVQ